VGRLVRGPRSAAGPPVSGTCSGGSSGGRGLVWPHTVRCPHVGEGHDRRVSCPRQGPLRWRRLRRAATVLEKASGGRAVGNAAMAVRVGKCRCLF
jgi:hypothetical protein